MPIPSILQILVLVVALVAATEATSRADSALLLPYPKETGMIPAATYDQAGKRIGPAWIRISQNEDGHFLLESESGSDGGAGNSLAAEMEVVEVGGKRGLRLLYERSQSVDRKGNDLALLEVDHRNGEARCTPPGTTLKRMNVVKLPSVDRISNVPLQLLFKPLVRGDVERIDVNVFFCLGKPRILNFAATAQNLPSSKGRKGPGIRQVKYGASGGSVLSWLAKQIGPTIYFWFENEPPYRYLGHYMPLYSGGPEVYIVREGVDPATLIKAQP